MRIALDHQVTISYELHDHADGALLDRSEDGAPLEYLHGRGRIIPGLEGALEGKAVGERFQAVIAPADAYGEIDPALDTVFDRSLFPEDVRDQLEAGMRFRAPHPAQPRRAALFTITAVEDGRISATANHPLAGKTLRFDVEVISVRPATEEEVQAALSPCGGCHKSGSCGDEGCGGEGHGEGHQHGEGCGCGGHGHDGDDDGK